MEDSLFEAFNAICQTCIDQVGDDCKDDLIIVGLKLTNEVELREIFPELFDRDEEKELEESTEESKEESTTEE